MHRKEYEARIAQYNSYTDEARKKKDTRDAGTSMLRNLLTSGDGIWHDLDFTQYDPACVFEVSKNNNKDIARISNKSLFDMIVKGIQICREEE